MKILINRLRNRCATTPNILQENDHSFGRLSLDPVLCNRCGKCQSACPSEAVEVDGAGLRVDYGRCIFCQECIAQCPTGALTNTHQYQLGQLRWEGLLEEHGFDGASPVFTDADGEQLREMIYRKFHRSLVLREVDAGSCNACEQELTALNNAYYDLARFGVKFAASPRHADGIVVTGPVAINMREGLVKTYQALSAPRLVIACGSCALSGGIFRDNYAVYNGVANVLPVDLFIPGCPPSPAAIAYGIFKLMGRL